MGIMMKPAEARAMAPVVRFARLESWGKDDEDEEDVVVVMVVVLDWRTPLLGEEDTTPVEASRLERATCCLRAFKLEK